VPKKIALFKIKRQKALSLSTEGSQLKRPLGACQLAALPGRKNLGEKLY